MDLDKTIECEECGEEDPAREMIIRRENDEIVRVVHPDCSEPSDRII